MSKESKKVNDFNNEITVENMINELVKKALNPLENVKMRKIPGGPSPEMVKLAMDNISIFLDED